MQMNGLRKWLMKICSVPRAAFRQHVRSLRLQSVLHGRATRPRTECPPDVNPFIAGTSRQRPLISIICKVFVAWRPATAAACFTGFPATRLLSPLPQNMRLSPDFLALSTVCTVNSRSSGRLDPCQRAVSELTENCILNNQLETA